MNGARGFNNCKVPLIIRILVWIPIIFASDEDMDNSNGEDNSNDSEDTDKQPIQHTGRRRKETSEKYSTIAPKYQQHNVRGLYELQRRELYEWYFAVRHDCRWQYRKFVVYVWGNLCNHKESSDSRKSVIWYRQSNSELASAGESGQTLTRDTLPRKEKKSPDGGSQDPKGDDNVSSLRIVRIIGKMSGEDYLSKLRKLRKG
ncbi:hypothetical protein G5I_08963 [Acromyrmex echinatior]|uniref:Uncharacterized protein n=1 Tax=Acromyrmex echinatior TaxID=103372 RepID=F4WSX1_ACREC|nr:hypothetical protein G5I_08963 [Acromyrmex echinatior]